MAASWPVAGVIALPKGPQGPPQSGQLPDLCLTVGQQQKQLPPRHGARSHGGAEDRHTAKATGWVGARADGRPHFTPLYPRPALQRAVPLAVALACGALLGACRNQPQVQARPPLSVQVEAAKPARFGEVVNTVSTLEALGEVNMAAQAGGRIQRLFVRQGDLVRPGQPLLVLDQTQTRADVARLEAEMETKKLNYLRFEYLVSQGAASPIQRDQLRQDFISTRMNLISRAADLGFRDLRAPIAGIVGDVQVKEGDVIQAGAPFTKIIRNDRLVARIDVPAVFSARLRPGLPVILMDPASNRPIAQSAIRSLDPAVAPGTQALLAKADFPNPTGLLRNGLRTRTTLVLDARDQLSVPFAAVSQISGQSFVFVAGSLAELAQRPGQAQLDTLRNLPPSTLFALQTPVLLGPLQNNRYPVLAGLKPGQNVITTNLINLRHGLPVRLY
ncbi:MAG: efflux RND transporter periplasmic adaptor subunit [Synechococcaceae cyanobacterium]